MKKIKILPPRPPLTGSELEQLTVDQIASMKFSDDELARLRAINQARNEERKARGVKRASMLGIEQEPILVELRSVGVDTDSVWSLLKRVEPYPEAIPVLLKHLSLPYSDVTKDGLARALAVPESDARRAWPLLVKQYKDAPSGRGIVAPGETEEFPFGAKDGLACALSVAVSDQALPEFISLVKDRANGESRVLLLKVLRKRRKKDPEIARLIEELADDPDLKKEIASWE